MVDDRVTGKGYLLVAIGYEKRCNTLYCTKPPFIDLRNPRTSGSQKADAILDITVLRKL